MKGGTESKPAVVAVIPARGGSKSIPRKNLIPVGGKPLLARCIDAALACGSVDRVIVSSDDAEILALARDCGAVGLIRPAELATDEASSESALLHAVETLAADGEAPEILVFLQCTSPFTEARHVAALVDAVRAGADSALTVSRNHYFIWREEAGRAVGVNHDAAKQRLRRQDLAPEYRENGAGYAMRVEAFRAARSRFCGRTVVVETDLPAVEIDHLEDIPVVEALLASLHRPAASVDLGAIQALVTDFDGVHTDDLVYVGDDGREMVRCSRADGMGVSMLKAAGVEVLILSREENPVVTRRAEKLGVAVIQGAGDKLPVLTDWARGRGLALSAIAYLGNDVNDLSCMEAAGVAMAPADAQAEAKAKAHIVLQAQGGKGAVREACDLLRAGRTGRG